MTRGPSVDERKRLAEEARGEQEALPTEPLCVRVSAAVKLTGIGRSTLYELINAGEIETVKIGRSTFILYRSLKRLVLQVGVADPTLPTVYPMRSGPVA